jgi:hypothetical protein
MTRRIPRSAVYLQAALAAVCLLLALVQFAPSPAGAAGEQIVVTAEPPIGEIRPHGGPSAGLEPDKLIIEVKDASGRPLTNVKLDVRLDTPGTNFFISTDVPRIEGKTVLSWSGIAPNGRQEIEYAFPIRGTYNLIVNASPAPGSTTTFSTISNTIPLHIQEKGKSFAYLALFLGALFAFGAISGLVLGRANVAGRPR